MWRNVSIIFAVLAFMLIPLTASSWTSNRTTCDQQGLEGTWDVEIWAGDPSGNQLWDKCTLTIGPSGFIEAQGTYTDCMGWTADITGGQLTISSDCVVQGTIETSIGSLPVERGGVVMDQLILDKQ